MIPVVEKVLGFLDEMVVEIGHLSNNAKSTQGSLKKREVRQLNWIKLRFTFFRIYVLLDPNSFSISLHKSLAISSDAMFAKVQRARPTAYILE